MRILLVCDVDNVEDSIIGFENFIDQIMMHFSDSFKQMDKDGHI